MSSGRKPNFSEKEFETILDCLDKRPQIVNSNLKVPIGVKMKIWTEIAAKVNAVARLEGGKLCECERTAQEVNKKWTDFKSKLKIKTESIRKGKLPENTTFSRQEKQVFELLKKASCDDDADGRVSPFYVHFVDNSDKDKDHVDTKKETVEKLSDETEETNLSDNLDDICLTSDSKQESDTNEIADDSNARKSPTKRQLEEPQTLFTLPSFLKMPGITVIQEVPKESGGENSRLPRKKSKTRILDGDDSEVMALLWDSQKDVKEELKQIRRIMFRMALQKRKRLRQESEKIQLKKMELFLKCKQLGVNFENCLSKFL